MVVWRHFRRQQFYLIGTMLHIRKRQSHWYCYHNRRLIAAKRTAIAAKRLCEQKAAHDHL